MEKHAAIQPGIVKPCTQLMTNDIARRTKDEEIQNRVK